MVVSVVVRGPDWFFGVDSGFEFFALLALVFITLFSWKAYRFTKDKRYRTFTIAFVFMALGLLGRAVSDLLVAMSVQVHPLVLIGGYAGYIFLTLVSLVVFVALMLKAKQRAPLVLLLLVALLSVVMAKSVRLSFHSISIVLLAFISYHFIKNYMHKKSLTALLVCSAFVLLTLTQAAFIVDIALQRFFVIGHLLHVAAFGLLLVALVKVLRNK